MLNWVITFFLMAVIAAILGFGGLAGTFASIAQFLASRIQLIEHSFSGIVRGFVGITRIIILRCAGIHKYLLLCYIAYCIPLGINSREEEDNNPVKKM